MVGVGADYYRIPQSSLMVGLRSGYHHTFPAIGTSGFSSVVAKSAGGFAMQAFVAVRILSFSPDTGEIGKINALKFKPLHLFESLCFASLFCSCVFAGVQSTALALGMTDSTKTAPQTTQQSLPPQRYKPYYAQNLRDCILNHAN